MSNPMLEHGASEGAKVDTQIVPQFGESSTAIEQLIYHVVHNLEHANNPALEPVLGGKSQVITAAKIAASDSKIVDVRSVSNVLCRLGYNEDVDYVFVRQCFKAKSDLTFNELLAEAIKEVAIPIKSDEVAVNNMRPRKLADVNSIPRCSDRQDRKYTATDIFSMLGYPFDTVDTCSDVAMAERAEFYFKNSLAYNSAMGWLATSEDSNTWKRYGGNQAAFPKIEILAKVARQEASDLYAISSALMQTGRTEDAKAVGAHAHKIGSEAAKRLERQSTLKDILAAAQHRLFVDPSQFGIKEYVIAFKNELVWDHGKKRNLEATDHVIDLCPVSLDTEADQSEWFEVLEAMTGGDEHLAHTLQDIAGLALSGATNPRITGCAFGPPGTGKSTYANLLAKSLGATANTLDPILLTARSGRGELGASCVGRRLLTINEAGGDEKRKDVAFSSETFKTLSGGDEFAVRLLYTNQYSATPHHFILMVGNDPSNFTNIFDTALRERLIMLPFNQRLDRDSVGNERKLLDGQSLSAKMDDPTSPLMLGFVRWAVAGLDRMYSNQGKVYRCNAVLEASERYWEQADPTAEFWLDLPEQLRHQLDNNGFVSLAELYRVYQNWAHENGAQPLGNRNFKKACVERGLEEKKKDRNTRAWRATAKWNHPPTSPKGDRETKNTPFLPLYIDFSNYLQKKSKTALFLSPCLSTKKSYSQAELSKNAISYVSDTSIAQSLDDLLTA
jgi:P4 family phage/plasmid primase-like protien